MLKLTLGRRSKPAVLRSKLSLACLLVAVAGFFSAASAQQETGIHPQAYSGGRNARALVVEPINEARLVTLAGNTHPAANVDNDRGAVSDNLPLEHMQLVLQRPPELEKQLVTFMAEQQRKGSPEYHHWLTAKQFADRYGVSAEDIQKVSYWLQNHGFHIDSVLPSGMAIEFSGTAGLVKQAFHTEIHNLDVDGEAHFANMSDPRIPAALTGVVVGVHALHNFLPHNLMKKRTEFDTVLGSTTYYAVVPADLATIYNLNPAFSNGYTGTGQEVVVIEDTLLANTGDVATFRSAFGLSGYLGTFSQITATGTAATCGNSGVNGDEGEAALDAEWAGASAPDASVVLASCADTTTVFGGLIALQNLISSATPPQIVSISYGECESENGAAANASYFSTYQQAAALGTSIFVSSGDEGAASCDANRTVATHGIAVSGFTSTPYNVSVGGTDFGDTYASLLPDGLPVSTYWSASNSLTDGSALSYMPEIPWNDSCAGELLYSLEGFTSADGTAGTTTGFCNTTTGKTFRSTASGSGGPSTYEVGNKPAWQSVLGNPSDNTRDIPDVSLFSANGLWNHFLMYCLTDASEGGVPCDYTNATDVNALAAGGTSFASPIMAGIQALINQSQGGPALGNPNPRLYALGNIEFGATGAPACNSNLGPGESSTCVFNDVTLGDMDVNCTGITNCFDTSGTGKTAVQGALSTSTSTLSIAYGTNTGWDFSTGLGSVNVFNLIQNWDLVQTTTAVTSSTSLLAVGESVTFTATITPAIGSTEVGQVAWSSNTGCGVSTVSAGVATCTTTSLPQGTDTVTATYGGDGTYASGSGSIIQTVVPAPAITSSASATFTVGTPGSFTVTTSGSPTPAISESGSLPAGVTFTDNGNGTATIAGTPAAATGGSYPLTITANNGTTNATQSFTLTVNQTQFQLTTTANPAVGGTISPASGTLFNAGTVVPLVATPAAGYMFVGWTSAADPVASATSASTTITMNGPESVTAQFALASTTPATLTSPTPGSTLSATSTTFTWTTATGATGYILSVGTTGVGSFNLYYSGSVPATSATLNPFPANGETIYVRLTTNFNGVWKHIDYTYTAGTQAALTAPAPSSVLTGPSVTFQWTSATGATGYILSVGTTGVGSFNLYYSGSVTATSATVSPIPTNGSTIYVRLTTNYNGTWLHTDSTYTASTLSALTTPTPGTALPGPSTTFTWTPATGATGYILSLGSTGAGSFNLYYSGSVTGTTATVNNLPTNGETIYARLTTNYNGTWLHTDYTYAAASQSVLTSPAPSSTLTSSSAEFVWTPAAGATGYILSLGTTGVGSYNLYYSGSVTGTTANVNNLPTNGATIYARLTTNYNGTWVHTDYTYTAQ